MTRSLAADEDVRSGDAVAERDGVASLLGAAPVLPLLLFVSLFFLLPLFRVLLESLHLPGLSLVEYWKIFAEPVYLRVMGNTFWVAGGVTVSCLLLGYPVAYLLVTSRPAARNIMIVCILMPLMTSFLVRTYAWMVLLQREGVLNQGLLSLGLITQPLELMYNRFGVYVGMVHILLPFMILPLFSIMHGIDQNLLEAAQNLGAPPLQVFLRIFFPLSLPGVAAGVLFVFMLALGFYITPALLGGRKDIMIAVLIDQQATLILNWPAASTLATLLLLVTLIIYLVYDRVMGIDRMWGGLGI